MGYNHASAFAPPVPRPKFFPPFEGPVIGLPTAKHEQIIGKFKPAIFPKIGESQAESLFNYRVTFIDYFVAMVNVISETVDRKTILSWMDRNIVAMGTVEAIKSAIRSGDALKWAEVCAAELSKPS